MDDKPTETPEIGTFEYDRTYGGQTTKAIGTYKKIGKMVEMTLPSAPTTAAVVAHITTLPFVLAPPKRRR